MPFQPFPFLGNAHVQTVLKTLLPAIPFRHPVEKRLIEVDNGDQLALHDTTPANWRPGDPLVIIVHGLSGCHGSVNVVGLANVLVPRGLRVVRLDLRGAGAGAGLARSTYNAACSHDVRAAVLHMHACSPQSPIVLVGFSLGGNIVLKMTGEATVDPIPGLTAVAAVGPPVDMVRCAGMLERPINRFYDSYFTSRLVSQVLHLQTVFPDLPRVQFPARLRLRGFDELYTAPRGGFVNAQDYYERSSAMPMMERIRLPMFIITARDDPFIAVAPFERMQPRPGLRIEISEQGGHLGFLGRDGAGGYRWLEHQLANWILRTIRW